MTSDKSIVREFKMFCRQQGIYIQYSPPYTLQLDGSAERLNGILNNKARCILADSNISKDYWSETKYSSPYIQNRSPPIAVQGKNPAKSDTVENRILKNLRIFDFLCVKTKFDANLNNIFH